MPMISRPMQRATQTKLNGSKQETETGRQISVLSASSCSNQVPAAEKEFEQRTRTYRGKSGGEVYLLACDDDDRGEFEIKRTEGA